MTAKKKDNARLADLRARAMRVSERINEQSDLISEKLREAEDELAAWNLGVSVFVDEEPLEMQLDEEGPSLVTEELGYARIGGSWRLVARSVTSGENPSYRRVRPLRDCPRDLRLNAVDLLPTLMERLLDAAEEKVREVESKASRIESIISEIRA